MGFGPVEEQGIRARQGKNVNQFGERKLKLFWQKRKEKNT